MSITNVHNCFPTIQKNVRDLTEVGGLIADLYCFGSFVIFSTAFHIAAMITTRNRYTFTLILLNAMLCWTIFFWCLGQVLYDIYCDWNNSFYLWMGLVWELFAILSHYWLFVHTLNMFPQVFDLPAKTKTLLLGVVAAVYSGFFIAIWIVVGIDHGVGATKYSTRTYYVMFVESIFTMVLYFGCYIFLKIKNDTFSRPLAYHYLTFFLANLVVFLGWLGQLITCLWLSEGSMKKNVLLAWPTQFVLVLGYGIHIISVLFYEQFVPLILNQKVKGSKPNLPNTSNSKKT